MTPHLMAESAICSVEFDALCDKHGRQSALSPIPFERTDEDIMRCRTRPGLVRSAFGHKRTSCLKLRHVCYGSGADIERVAANVRFGPGADIGRVASNVGLGPVAVIDAGGSQGQLRANCRRTQANPGRRLKADVFDHRTRPRLGEMIKLIVQVLWEVLRFALGEFFVGRMSAAGQLLFQCV